jgi:hypothetical protein
MHVRVSCPQDMAVSLIHILTQTIFRLTFLLAVDGLMGNGSDPDYVKTLSFNRKELAILMFTLSKGIIFNSWIPQYHVEYY